MGVMPPISLLDASLEQDSSDKPLHSLLRARLDSVINHYFEDGQQFWTEAMLSEHLNVSRITIRRAIQDLSRDGKLYRFRAKGTFVHKDVPSRDKASAPAPMAALPSIKYSYTTVGLFVPTFDAFFWADIIDRVAAACSSAGLILQIYRTHAGETGEQAARQIRHLPQNEVIILLGNDPELTEDLYLTLHQHSYRVMCIDTLLPDMPCGYVGMNNDLAIRVGMKHLIDLGHERITFVVCEPEKHLVGQARIAAFETIAESRGLEYAEVVHLGNDGTRDPYELTYSSMPTVWRGRPTAVFTISDQGAWAALKWFNDHDIQVPDQISVLGIDDLRSSKFTSPSLSSVGQPYTEMALRALEMLDSADQSMVLLPPILAARASTAPPPAQLSGMASSRGAAMS